MAWKARIVRTVNQELAMPDTLESLECEVVIVMGWTMKILPMYFRESQTDFFGKRGRS